MAALLRQCPVLMLDTKTTFYNGKRMGLDQVREIEKHVASCIYLHPPLKALVFKEGPVKDTTPLLLACHYGELDAVKHLVERWGVNVQDAALYYNHVEYNLLIKLLIDKGTPLIAAAFEGHLNVVRYLVGKGADVCAKASIQRSFNGLTALHGVVLKHSNGQSPSQLRKRNDIVRLLLESGADPSTPCSKRIFIWMRPLCGIDALTASLIDHGMPLNQRDLRGQTILHLWASLPRHLRKTH